MSKRSRFILILAVIAVCFAFLWPSVKWYYITPKEDQALALGSREKIKDYARNMAVSDLKELMAQARAESQDAIPAKYADLAKEAAKNPAKQAPEKDEKQLAKGRALRK